MTEEPLPKLTYREFLDDDAELPFEVGLATDAGQAVRVDLAVSLAENAVQLGNDLVAYRRSGLVGQGLATSRFVLRELVELVILLDPDVPLPEVET